MAIRQPKTSYLRHALGRTPDGSEKTIRTPRERVEELHRRITAAKEELERIQQHCSHTTENGRSAYEPMAESACAAQCQICLKVI